MKEETFAPFLHTTREALDQSRLADALDGLKALAEATADWDLRTAVDSMAEAYAMMLPLDSAPDRLDYLMSSARNQALRSIRSCTNRGIVCLYSIEQFQEAETAKTDPLTAIPYYWQAELSAKALKIIFE